MKTRKTILITGGAGTIGTGYAHWLTNATQVKLLDLPGSFKAEHHELGFELIESNLTDIDSIRGHFQDVDVVIHLAGERRPSALWDSLLQSNVIGAYNSLAAAISAQCQHFIYASSVHAVSGGSRRLGITEDLAVQPADLYGVTKCFGEALGYFASQSTSIKFTALRIGAFQESDAVNSTNSGWMLVDYCAPKDLFGLLDSVISKQDANFAIYNAASNNTFGRLSMEKAELELGYRPSFDSFSLASPFHAAIAEVGGLADKPAASGMRADL